MKIKPAFIIPATILLIASTVFLVRCKTTQKADAAELTQFLNKLNNSIKEHNTDTLLSCFQADKKAKAFKRVINLLSGKKEDGKANPVATISLNVDKANIKNLNTEMITVSLPATFNHDPLNDKASALVLKIYQVAAHQYKIVQVDARQFLTDYGSYEKYVMSKTVSPKDMFSAMTLAAFKTAGQLKTKYDSVIWFDYIDNKTYYYVVKGTWDENGIDSLDDKKYKPAYKMGLVNPDLKEIIPPEYDLIHNVNGTIAGLIEVEKDSKKGFYNLDGKNVVPVIYDQVFPLNDNENIAVFRNNDDYFYLKKDLSVTEKISGFKITDVLPKIKTYGSSYTLSDSTSKNIMEYNSDQMFVSIVIPPSYLSDLQILPKLINFQNPLRHEPEDNEDDGYGSASLDVKFEGAKKEGSNWFQSAYYSVVDDFLGSRAGLYETKHLMLVDNKQNRILGFKAASYFGNAEGGAPISGMCKENYLRAVNDTLFEFKTTSNLGQMLLNGQELAEGPYFHYLHVQNGKLEAIPCERVFACTKFVKMDDSYLQSCFVIGKNSVDHMTPEVLSYMKNEIFASYGYKFNNPKWTEIFQSRFDRFDGAKNTNVNDSLTAIEKYNINWITSKLNQKKNNALAVR